MISGGMFSRTPRPTAENSKDYVFVLMKYESGLIRPQVGDVIEHLSTIIEHAEDTKEVFSVSSIRSGRSRMRRCRR